MSKYLQLFIIRNYIEKIFISFGILIKISSVLRLRYLIIKRLSGLMIN